MSSQSLSTLGQERLENTVWTLQQCLLEIVLVVPLLPTVSDLVIWIAQYRIAASVAIFEFPQLLQTSPRTSSTIAMKLHHNKTVM